jgi:hypothetical protein
VISGAYKTDFMTDGFKVRVERRDKFLALANALADRWGVTKDFIFAKSRLDHRPVMKQILIMISRAKHPDITGYAIGLMMDMGDHTSVLKAARTGRSRLEKGEKLFMEYYKMVQDLAGDYSLYAEVNEKMKRFLKGEIDQTIRWIDAVEQLPPFYIKVPIKFNGEYDTVIWAPSEKMFISIASKKYPREGVQWLKEPKKKKTQCESVAHDAGTKAMLS